MLASCRGKRRSDPSKSDPKSDEKECLRVQRFWLCLVLLLGLTTMAHAQSMVDGSLTGTVTDPEGVGQGGVQVKVFVDGFVRGSAVTGGTGQYDLTYRYDQLGDQTIVVWFLPQAGYVPEILVLRESTAAKQMGIWSPCLSRLTIAPSLQHDVTVYTESGKFDALSQSECL
jgi:hypothetical protein